MKSTPRTVAPACRTCGSRQVIEVGALPEAFRFAGVIYESPFPGGSLWRCQECHLSFRHPLLPDYETLYMRGTSDVWDTDGDRKDFDLVRAHIVNSGADKDVLDIGCYTGRLLASLPDAYRVYGVEMNQAAASVAQSRGIRIVAQSFDELRELDAHFDIITACDVIEHVPNPLKLLETLRRRLRDGGQLIVTTGDADGWLWRVAGSSYWYCYYPEHISFVGRKWFERVAASAGFRLAEATRFNYQGWRWFHPMTSMSLIGAWLYAISPRGFRSLHAAVSRRGVEHFNPPGCGATKDHLLCVLSAV